MGLPKEHPFLYIESVVNYQRILKECFWDMNLSDTELAAFAAGDDPYKKQIIFQKILENSTDLLQDLALFSRKDIESLIDNYAIPEFNREYYFRRKNLAEVYFLNRPLLIKELQWNY